MCLLLFFFHVANFLCNARYRFIIKSSHFKNSREIKNSPSCNPAIKAQLRRQRVYRIIYLLHPGCHSRVKNPRPAPGMIEVSVLACLRCSITFFANKSEALHIIEHRRPPIILQLWKKFLLCRGYHLSNGKNINLINYKWTINLNWSTFVYIPTVKCSCIKNKVSVNTFQSKPLIHYFI